MLSLECITINITITKKGDPSELDNNRPVSLLSFINKLMERLVFKVCKIT